MVVDEGVVEGEVACVVAAEEDSLTRGLAEEEGNGRCYSFFFFFALSLSQLSNVNLDLDD